LAFPERISTRIPGGRILQSNELDASAARTSARCRAVPPSRKYALSIACVGAGTKSAVATPAATHATKVAARAFMTLMGSAAARRAEIHDSGSAGSPIWRSLELRRGVPERPMVTEFAERLPRRISKPHPRAPSAA